MPTSEPLDLSWEAKERRIAQYYLGSAMDWYYDPMHKIGSTHFVPGVSGSGVVPTKSTTWTSAYEFDTGATAGSVSKVRAATADTKSILGAAGEKYYFAIKMVMNTAVDASTECGFGLENGANALIIGAIGAASAANFGCAVGGATYQASTIALDTEVAHTLRIAHDGSSYYFSVDTEAMIAVSNTNRPTATKQLIIHANNGATAASRKFTVLDIIIAHGET